MGNVVHAIYGDGEEIVYLTAFADKMKVYAAKTLGFSGHPRDLISAMNDYKARGVVSHGITGSDDWHEVNGRDFLVNVGQSARAQFGEDFWVNQVLPRPVTYDENNPDAPAAAAMINYGNVQEMYPDVACLVITDVRMDNEAERIKRLGGVVWEVQRPGVESDGSPTEQQLTGIYVDHIIHNDGSLSDLERKVEDALGRTLV